MHKKDYIWLFNQTALMSGINAPLSLEYHLPSQKLHVLPKELIDARLWLVSKDEGIQYLFAFVTPIFIERYTEGTYKDDYLLSADPYQSVRLMSRVESNKRWIIDGDSDTDGIRECSDHEQSLFAGLIKDNELASFGGPQKSLIKTIQRTGFDTVEQAVPDQLQLTLRILAFGDAIRSRNFPDPVSSLGGTALEVLHQIDTKFDSEDAIRLMSSLDPLAEGNSRGLLKSPIEGLEASEKLAPTVDTFLVEVDTDKISPRVFIARSPHHPNDWLEKTSQAEESHEKILKDTVLYMKSEGFKASKSRSFDLYAEKGDSRLLIEIKSTTNENLVAQGEKGIIQLLRYSIALESRVAKSTKFIVLLQYRPLESALHYLTSMAQRAGFSIWLYDESRSWPNRVFSVNSKEKLPL